MALPAQTQLNTHKSLIYFMLSSLLKMKLDKLKKYIPDFLLPIVTPSDLHTVVSGRG